MHPPAPVPQGFQYMELEANLSEEGTDVYGEYTPLTARDILVKDIDDLKVGDWVFRAVVGWAGG